MYIFIIDINKNRKDKLNEIIRNDVRIADLIKNRIQNYFSHLQIILFQ